MRKRPKSLRWLHTAGRLMQQGQAQSAALRQGDGVLVRRVKQRQQLGQRLLEQETKGWLMPQERGAVFWRALRWGGAGFTLAWVIKDWIS